MARRDDQAWGTWEELLLACAVQLHGTKSWESVAMEIQSRTSSPLLMTPQNCKQKYHDLQRRFMQNDEKIDEKDDKIENGEEKIPWLDELRKLRVAELRREVQRYDVSIVSLELKVKKLKEEREQSMKKKENSEENTDLEKDSKKVEVNVDDDTEKDKSGEEKQQSPENVVGKRIPGDESDRDNQSFNESNSTDQKSENREAASERKPEEQLPKPESEAKVAAAGRSDPVSAGVEKATGEGSYNGSSDTIAKGTAASPATKSPDAVPARESGESAEFRESVAESKGEEGAKENSDVQSSASLSKKRRRRKSMSGSSSGDEPETDEVSPISKRISVKSHPLMAFLEIIWSHKYGSVFERRLESQETADYQSLIRQHIDLEMVKTKIEEGHYSDSCHEFLRDILLLFNNAIVFFPKNSRESLAAFQLRQIVSKEMPSLLRKLTPHHPTKEATPPSPIPESKPQKLDRETASSLPEKPAPSSSAPSLACRKRSSITAKSNSPATEAKPAEKEEVQEKQDAETKDADNSSANVTAAIEPRVTKQRTKERSAPVTRGTRTSKSRSSSNNNNNNSKPASNSNSRTNPNHSLNSTRSTPLKESSEEKSDKKNPSASTVAKKRSAANFLNRMKRSNSNNGALLETLKNSTNSSTNTRGNSAGERKKGGRDSGKKGEQNTRRESAGKQAPDHSGPAKRSVGRPPKRAAPPPPHPSSSRRGKEVVEEKPPARKRGRR